LEQSQECFLENLFAVRDGETEAEQISKETVSQFVKKVDHFLFERGWRGRFDGAEDGGGSEDVRLWRRGHLQ
jgi:hypothetical protein